MKRSGLFLVLVMFLIMITVLTMKECWNYDQSVAAVYEIKSLQRDESYTPFDMPTLYYNFCEGLFDVDEDALGCSDEAFYYEVFSSAAAIINVLNNSCFMLTNDTIPEFSLKNPSDPFGGLYLEYPPGSYVPGANNVTYNFKILLKCNRTNGNYTFESLGISGDYNQNYLITASSKQGCPESTYYQLGNFIMRNWVIFLAAGVALGIFMGFFGLKFFKWTLAFVEFVIIFFFAAHILCNLFLGDEPSVGTEWSCIFVCSVLGILVSLLLLKFEKIGAFFLGAGFGISVSFLLYDIVLSNISATPAVLSLLTISTTVVCGIIALLVDEEFVIIASSVTGAYLTVKSASLTAPMDYVYINEFGIAREIYYNGDASIPWTLYLYFIIAVLLAVGGGVYQYKQKQYRDLVAAQQSGSFVSANNEF